MPRGDKSSYSNKQKRQAAHIEESYRKRGLSEKNAEARAWRTVNKQTGGAKKKSAGRAGKAAGKRGSSPAKKRGAKSAKKISRGSRAASSRKTSARKSPRKR